MLQNQYILDISSYWNSVLWNSNSVLWKLIFSVPKRLNLSSNLSYSVCNSLSRLVCRLKLQSDHFSYPTALCIQGTSSICSVSYFILKYNRTTTPSPPPGVILPTANPHPVNLLAPLCLSVPLRFPSTVMLPYKAHIHVVLDSSFYYSGTVTSMEKVQEWDLCKAFAYGMGAIPW